MSGKGSTPRPIPDRAAYEANWDAINWVRELPETAGSGEAGSQEAGRGNEAGGHEGGG